MGGVGWLWVVMGGDAHTQNPSDTSKRVAIGETST